MPTIIIRDGETPNWMFLPAGNESKLKTSSMGDCWALIIKNPDGSRLLAHVPAGDVRQLQGGGGVTAINGHIRAGATAVIVLGVSNQTESKYIMELKYQELRERLHALPDYQTIDGFYEFAKVDAEGTITLTDVGGSQWEIS